MRYKKGNATTKTLIVLTIIGLVLGAFFLSPILTGSAVADLNQTTSTWVGGLLLVLAIFGIYACNKARK